MSTMTYDTVPTAEVTATASTPAAKRPGFFARMMERMVEARMRQALNEVRRYGIVLPREIEEARSQADKR